MRPPSFSTALGRSVVRHSFRSRPATPARFVSSNANVTEATQKKAQDALGNLGKNAEKLWQRTKMLMGTVGDGLGSMLGTYRQPLLYNLSVTREILKQIYVAESLQPPTTLSTIQNAYATLWSRASSPAYWRQIASNGELARVGIYALEAYGIFKIGEIIGRRSLVGYNLH